MTKYQDVNKMAATKAREKKQARLFLVILSYFLGEKREKARLFLVTLSYFFGKKS